MDMMNVLRLNQRMNDMLKQDMPLPKTVGPKDMSYVTFQYINALARGGQVNRIIAVLALLVGSAALVLALWPYI
jgi:hypothetical protein